MLIVKLRNAVKICDKMTFCTARFSWIKVRHLTDSRFKRVGVFRRMTFLAKSRRNSGGQSSDIMNNNFAFVRGGSNHPPPAKFRIQTNKLR